MNLFQLVSELDELLDAESIVDYCPNGLQVEGRPGVTRIITAVSASRALFTRAVDHDADAILVHHGLLWNSSEAQRLVGALRERIRLLIENRIEYMQRSQQN
jgi:putative NIF3 family GTP cyclohydrolase 1 type 2